jgi:predicted patatin/cPLA2 family phospholipase
MLDRGLVLEGGGLRGQYTAGVLDAFLDAKLSFPYLVGVSAGSSIGCSFVSRQRGRNLEIIERFRNDPRYLSWRNFIRTGSLFGMDFIFDEIPHGLVPFDFATFERSQTRFVTVCTDCERGEAVYYGKEGDNLTVLKASASMPYLSRPVNYDGRKLLDGAITDALPLRKAIVDGFALNVVVLTRPAGYRKTEERGPSPSLFYGRWPLLVEALRTRVKRYNEQLEFVEAEEAAGRALVIRPSRDLGISRTEKDVAKLRSLYELGLSDGAAAAAELAQA